MSGPNTRPISVCEAWSGKHLFEQIGDPRVVRRPLSDAAAPDVLVFPSEKAFIDFGRAERETPSEIWARAREGAVLLVFDGSVEGYGPNGETAEAIQAFLARNALPARQMVYVTQNRDYQKRYEAICAEHGWEPVRVLCYDFHIKRYFQSFAQNGEAVFAERLATFRARKPKRSRRFVCLNFTPRPIKVMLLLRLMRDGLWDQGFISFGGFGRPGGPPSSRVDIVRDRITGGRRFRDLGGPELAAYLDRLDALGQVMLSPHEANELGPARTKPPTGDDRLPQFNDSWFTIVTETEIEGTRRITEKPFKSLVNFHPSILLGNRGSLNLVRKFGFQTFDGYVDESYDVEKDPRRRFEGVYEEIRRLCALDEQALGRMEAEIEEVLIANARWGLTRLPAVYREKFDVRFVDALAALLPAGQPPV